MSKVIVAELFNPETLLVEELTQWLQDEVKFSQIYANFGRLRVDPVHPFALLLLQEVLGEEVRLDMFPSITISDSSDSETAEMLGKNYQVYALQPADVALIREQADGGRLTVAESAMAAVEEAVNDKGYVAAEHWTYQSQHSLDFNIWSDNKTVTAAVYDLVKLFLVTNSARFHEHGLLDFQAGAGGRRSGDINVEFGKLLYGANVSATCTISLGVMRIDLDMELIEDIEPDPAYRYADEEVPEDE